MIYLDNAATTPLLPVVVDAMMPYFTTDFGNPDSPHSAGDSAADAIWHAREQLAAFVGCRAQNIVFTSGGTEANNLAIFDAAKFLGGQGLRHIITSAAEHKSVLEPIKELELHGFHVTYLSPGRKGYISTAQVEEAINKETGLVSLMYVNNETGAVTNINRIGRLCMERNIMFHVDCVQAAGFYSLNCAEMHADYITISSHKIHGPKGVGCLYVAQPTLGPSLLYGGEQEWHMRPGTPNVPGIVGFGEAAEIAGKNLKTASQKITKLSKLLSGLLLDISDCHANFDLERTCPKVMSFSFDDVDAETLVMSLSRRGLCVSNGAACNTYSSEPSYVLLASGLSYQESAGTIRISLSDVFTTEEQVVKAAKIIDETVSVLRSKKS